MISLWIAKGGQKTLLELDEYRYRKALENFNTESRAQPMALDDIKTLVEWKLRHGKFRPTLMKLVSSNDPSDAQDVVKQAVEMYDKTADIGAAVKVLTKLRGIGPATASLLLAVHDASRVIFFSDEAFWWLCCDSKQSPIKYDAKEYSALCSKFEKLRDRLGVVKASDAEKVAYVLMKQPDQPEQSHGAAPVKKEKEDTSTKPAKKRKPDVKETKKADNVTHEQPSLRRSKRHKS
ncbi:hypothetical protein NW752_012174 [Fusarium irregulare]|nr:hypothetical protein NW752_012174 [Fusarium irregulare]